MKKFNNQKYILDFRKLDFLRYDKHTVISSYVSELVFREDLLRSKKLHRNVSTKWWCVKSRSGYIFLHLTTQMPNEHDMRIYETFVQKGIPCYVVSLICVDQEEHQREFRFLHVNQHLNRLKDGTHPSFFLSVESFLRSVGHIKEMENPPEAKPEQLIRTKQAKAYKAVKKLGLLVDVIMERFFANHILHVHFPIVHHMDGFLCNEKGIWSYAMKFTYPTRWKTYGINIGYSYVCEWLFKKGIRSIYYILTKPAGKGTDFLDVLENPSWIQESKWIYCEIKKEFIREGSRHADASTQLHGKKQQNFREMDVKHFKVIKPFHVDRSFVSKIS